MLRSSALLAPIAQSLLLQLYPEAQLMRSEGRLVSLWLEPQPPPASLARLREMLSQLVDRPEWRARSALVREVSDREGSWLELLVPVAPYEYQGGAAVVGPFPDEAAADEFGVRRASPDLEHDTFPCPAGWLTDFFELPGPAWESGAPAPAS